MRHANLVGVARLPNNLFTENANTEVGSDLILLQKNSNKNGELYYLSLIHILSPSFQSGSTVSGAGSSVSVFSAALHTARHPACLMIQPFACLLYTSRCV